MTPSLAAVHDSLVQAVADRPWVGEVRARFEARVGPFTPSDPWFEERSSALWDRVLVDPRAQDALPRLAPEPRAVLERLSRAQRGLFEVHPGAHGVDLVCRVRGAAFRLSRADDLARAMALGADAAGGLVDAHVVATIEGVALLPGILVHPAEATEPIHALLSSELGFDDLLDALLAMRHRLAARSRVRAKQVYRADALARREA